MFYCQSLPYSHNIARVSGSLNTGTRVYATTVLPSRDHDFTDWPARAATYMQQAVEVLSAPDAAVMLAGSAVDAMLKEKGYENGSVYARIEAAEGDGLLTSAMSEWAHAVRLAANNPRHSDLNSPHATRGQAKASLEFVNALGQFLFVLPARVERGKLEAATALDAGNPLA